MATISSASSTNLTSSLYNSANIVSGLASGLDTEGMIEGLVQSYSTKIQNLTNQATKIEWKQEAYRNIISKMYAFSNKYTSYTSSTNLLSQSFFSNAVNVATQGANADKISASGRTDSEIIVKSVSQLATSTRYVTDSNLIGSDNGRNITAADGLDMTGTTKMGTLQGSLSFNYGNTTISISFNNMKDLVEGSSAQERTKSLAELIEQKLGDETVILASGESVKASDRIQVSVSNGKITFSDKSSAKNDVYINGVSGDVGTVLGLTSSQLNDEDNRVRSIDVASDTQFVKDVANTTILSNQTMNINLDGTTKTIKLPAIVNYGDGSYTIRDINGVGTTISSTSSAADKQKMADAYVSALNVALKKAFGEKVTASNVGENGELKLQLTAPDGSEMLVNTDVGDILGIGNSASNYLSTSKTLGELLGTDENGSLNGLAKNYDTGKYDFVLNGVKVGSYDENTTLAELMSDVNASDAGVKLTYSNTTREFVFTAKDTGTEGKVELGDGLAEAMFGRKSMDVDTTQKTRDMLGMGDDETLAGKTFSATFANGSKVEFTFNSNTGTLDQMLTKINDHLTDGATASFDSQGELVITDKDGNTFGVRSYGSADEVAARLSERAKELTAGGTLTAGQDAKFVVNVNGTEKEMTRSSNTTTIDGLSIKLKGTFEDDGEGVSFQRSVDADKIIDAIKTMIADYNDMMSEIRSAYATMPYQDSSGAFQTYEPLSSEDMATMSESAIQAYEAKAKQGILFGDSLLSGLYTKLRDAFDASSIFGTELFQMGIGVGYDGSDGSSYVSLDETKLRQMLEEDPDTVMNVFAGTASQPGIMQSLKTQLDRYAATTGATKGLLVEQAGTPLSSSSLLSNAWQKQIDNLGTQVETWQDKLSDRVDYYTSLFSKLEVLINQMNSQSSTLAGLMGG